MINSSLRRLGYGGRPMEGLSLQKIDPAFLFEVGSQLRRLRALQQQGSVANTYAIMDTAAHAVEQVVAGSIYTHLVRIPCRTAAHALVEFIRSLQAGLMERDDWDAGKVEVATIARLISLYDKFETLFLAELQSGAIYLVSPKAGFDTDALIEAGTLLFSSDLPAKVPDALPDLHNATRCIAFELATAAGFHLHRAHEAVLRVYWDCVTGGEPRPKQGNMGVYLRELETRKKGEDSVHSHLRSMKDFHRNPLMHPEQSLESVDEAIDLLSAIRCSIGYMLKEIPGFEVPLLEEMEAPPPVIAQIKGG